MTVITGIAAVYMCRVLAGCRDAVMAGTAGAQYLCVIDRKHGCPHIRGMAVFADIRGLHMRRTFARSIRAVMTAGTVSGDVDVIEVGGQPARRRVTVVASVAAGNVRRVLASRRDTVMAGTAGTQYLRMVDRKDRRPQVRGMAIFTDIARLNVRRALAGRFHAVMAAGTVAGDADVVKIGREPARCRVTIVTGVATRDMGRVFAGRCNAIVAGSTGADDLRVVNGKCRRKYVGVVTVFADIAGL